MDVAHTVLRPWTLKEWYDSVELDKTENTKDQEAMGAGQNAKPRQCTRHGKQMPIAQNKHL